MSTSKAISPPIGSEISALIRAPREGSSSSRDTNEILAGRGMLVAVESFRVGREIFRRGITRVVPTHRVAIRYPDSFVPACADDDSPEIKRFRARGGSTRTKTTDRPQDPHKPPDGADARAAPRPVRRASA